MSDVARFRRVKAAALVLALVLVVPGVDSVLKVVNPQRAGAQAVAGIDSRNAIGANDAFAALDRLDESVMPDGTGPPESFKEEIGFLPGADDVRVGESGSVVGYVVRGDTAEAMSQLKLRMESLGWTGVPLGEVQGATFIKQAGVYRWALVTCMQVGSETSVVVRCMTA